MAAIALPKEQASHESVLCALVSPQLAVAVWSERTPPEIEWKEYVRVLSAMSSSNNRMIVFSAGGGPNAMQRQDLDELTEKKDDKVRVAIVTGSRIARGIVTAISWIRKDTHVAFNPTDVNKALDYLQLNEEQRKAVLEYAKLMGDKLKVRSKIGV